MYKVLFVDHVDSFGEEQTVSAYLNTDPICFVTEQDAELFADSMGTLRRSGFVLEVDLN
jgi:hypothetical protein